jgi:osmoprotectant transport system permease protein
VSAPARGADTLLARGAGARAAARATATHVRRVTLFRVTLLILLAVTASPAPDMRVRRAEADRSPPPLTVGSKAFTESVILGELAAQLVTGTDAYPSVTHKRELGGTQILWRALRTGAIDVYPEYTGTIAEEIYAGRGLRTEEEIRRALEADGVRMTRPLGFNNTYAIGMRADVATRLGIRTISDLRAHPELRCGFSNEFLDRTDGWPSLRAAYRLPQTKVQGLVHDLAYRGLASGAVDLTDLYSTDAEIAYYHLRVLEDDLHHFPDYHAVFLYGARAGPKAERALRMLEGRITEADMIAMNGRAKLGKIPERRVAAEFLARIHGPRNAAARAGRGASAAAPPVREETLTERLTRRTGEHLSLVAVSLAGAILVALPLGVLAARRARAGQAILAVVGVVQTIPSLALLVFMIPVLGIGARPAIAALFLYSLLPIVRNTYAGLHDIAPGIRESAEALGLPPGARLRQIELPLASRAILAGIKTSAVINVGTATLGAVIGAGGYGQPILTGIRLDNVGLILEGAIPAAVLALLVQAVFELAERAVVPAGLRLRSREL